MIELKEINCSEIISRPDGLHSSPFPDDNIENLAHSIKKIGLSQPIIVSKNPDGKFILLDGLRRWSAFIYLNNKYPGEGFDKNFCAVIPLIDEYAAKMTGISKNLVNRYVKFARLPKLLQDNLGAIHKSPKTAVNIAVEAADALGWSPDSGVDEKKVFEFAKKLGERKFETEIGDRGSGYQGHIRNHGDGIIGDGYLFGGNTYVVIVVGEDKGIFKNGKKMKFEEFEKLPDVFKKNLRLQPKWE